MHEKFIFTMPEEQRLALEKMKAQESSSVEQNVHRSFKQNSTSVKTSPQDNPVEDKSSPHAKKNKVSGTHDDDQLVKSFLDLSLKTSLSDSSIGLSSTSENSEILDLSDRAITDDYIAANIQPIPPLSISDLITIITSKGAGSIKKMNLCGNYICIDGAITLLQYIADNMKQLNELNLAHNNLKGKRDAFLPALIKVLEMSSLETIDLTGAISKYKYKKLKAKLPDHLFKKIIWAE